jgi:hypothetical protein
MIATRRDVQLTTTFQQVDVGSDDQTEGKWITIVPQAAGTILWGESASDAAGTDGVRLTVTAEMVGHPLMTVPLGTAASPRSGPEHLFLAVPTGTLAIDVAEGGVGAGL